MYIYFIILYYIEFWESNGNNPLSSMLRFTHSSFVCNGQQHVCMEWAAACLYGMGSSTHILCLLVGKTSCVTCHLLKNQVLQQVKITKRFIMLHEAAAVA